MSTREDREAAMIAYNGPDSVNRPRHREWIERGGDDCGATVYEVAQAIANARAEGYARGQRAADERTAAAVERERERIRVMADGIADVAAMDAKRAPNGVTLAACAGRESAARMIADALRSRPPRAGEEAVGSAEMMQLAREADAAEVDLRGAEECAVCGHRRDEHQGDACRVLCKLRGSEVLRCGCEVFMPYVDARAAAGGEVERG